MLLKQMHCTVKRTSYFIGAYSCILSLPETALLKVSSRVCLKLPRGNLACLFIWTNIVRLNSKSRNLVSLERKDDRLNFGVARKQPSELSQTPIPPTAPSHSLKSGFLRIYLRLFPSVNKIIAKMVHFCTFTVMIANTYRRVGERSYIVKLKYRTYVHANQKPLGPNMTRKM